MRVLVFTKKTCPKCPPAKELASLLKDKEVDVSLYDLETADGLAEASMYGVMATPTIIIVGEKGTEKKSFRGVVPSLEEVMGVL